MTTQNKAKHREGSHVVVLVVVVVVVCCCCCCVKCSMDVFFLSGGGTAFNGTADGSPSDVIHGLLKKAIREVAQGKHGSPLRPDGRGLDEV